MSNIFWLLSVRVGFMEILKMLLISFLYFVEYSLVVLGFLFKPILFIARIIETLPCRPLGPRERCIVMVIAVLGYRLQRPFYFSERD